AGALIVLLAAYLALYPALFGYLWRKFFQRYSALIQLTLFAPALWLITESLRGVIFGGFPWLLAGYTQINGPLKNLAPLFGIDFITLMLVVISGFITLAYYQRSWRAICYAALLLTAPLLLQWVQWTTIDNRRQVSVALI